MKINTLPVPLSLGDNIQHTRNLTLQIHQNTTHNIHTNLHKHQKKHGKNSPYFFTWIVNTPTVQSRYERASGRHTEPNRLRSPSSLRKGTRVCGRANSLYPLPALLLLDSLRRYASSCVYYFHGMCACLRVHVYVWVCIWRGRGREEVFVIYFCFISCPTDGYVYNDLHFH